ncbi:MAG: TRAP transporter large permease [Synergistaceae bacterium]|jgi:C4-dicarboxylate transporter DctM subunit|nr:TRAP transporter large permease [Synergistaceae bacterium]
MITLLFLFVPLMLGFPIYTGLLLSGGYLLIFGYGVPADMLVTSMFDGVAKFSLSAVPFFLFAGCVMERTSIAARLVGCFTPWLIRARGGISIAAVCANEVFGAMSGSAPAAAGTIGKAMFPIVSKDSGESFALGLFASCGALAIIMPPSINMIIFATSTNVSISRLFKAGIIPALIIGLFLSAYLVKKSKPVSPDNKFDINYAMKSLWRGLPALSLPVLILGGIYGGIFTPSEAGAISAVYALIVAKFIFNEINWKIIIACLRDTVKLTGQIFILIAASTVFSQALAIAQVPAMLGNALSGLSEVSFLVLMNIVLLIAGAFFDPTSAILILAPVFIPISATHGIDPIHAGIIFTINLAIGMFTPPFGLNLFVIQGIFNKPMEVIAKSIVPFFFVYLVCLVIFTFCPQLYMWL